MKVRQGPRPWPIRAFAVLFIVASLVSLVDNAAGLARGPPANARDAEIIGMSVRFTIALMTAGLVWFFAARFARWLVPLALAAKVIATVIVAAMERAIPPLSPLWLLALLLGSIAAALLFAPAARPWFALSDQAPDHARA